MCPAGACLRAEQPSSWLLLLVESMPRSRLGPLAVESKLGDQPAESCVWRAVHVQFQRSIAVKMFTAPFGGTHEARADFAAEWETLETLQHPAIVRCYGGGFEQTDGYLAHELVQGETLASQLNRLGRLSWETVLDLAEPLADALEYLHGKKIVHGAIGPDKVLIAGLSPILIDVRLHRFTSPVSHRAATHDQPARDAGAGTCRGPARSRRRPICMPLVRCSIWR